MKREEEERLNRWREQERMEKTKTERGREFEGSSRHEGFHLSKFPRTRASPYPISYPRQFPSVNSIIYRYTSHPCGSTSASLPTQPPSPLLSSSAFSSSPSSSSLSSSSSSSLAFHISCRMRSKQDPDHYALVAY